jgi:hypothetical protein
MSYLFFHFLGGRGWLVYYGVHRVSYSISQQLLPPSYFNQLIQQYGHSDNFANFLRRLALVVLTKFLYVQIIDTSSSRSTGFPHIFLHQADTGIAQRGHTQGHSLTGAARRPQRGHTEATQ